MMRTVLALTCACVLGAATVAHADVNDQRALMRALYALFGGVPGANDGTTVMLNPGIALDSWDDPTDTTTGFRISEALDRMVPRKEWLYRPTGSSISAVYADILTAGVWAASSLTATERKELASINAQLFTDTTERTRTKAYERYVMLLARRDAARARWEATPEDERTIEMRLDLQETEEDLSLTGNAARFVALLARRDTLLAKSPRRWAAEHLARFTAAVSVSAGRSYHPSALRALNDAALDGPEWSTIELRFGQANGGAAPDAALPLPPEWRMWRVDDADSVRWLDSEMSEVTIRFEARVFDITRDWLEGAVVSSRAWKWPAGMTRPIAGSGPDDALPILPTQALLVRNLRVTGNFGAGELAQLAAEMRAGRATAWGPFATSGRYLASGDAFRARRVPQGFRVDDPQLVALIGEVVDRSPDPDPTLTW